MALENSSTNPVPKYIYQDNSTRTKLVIYSFALFVFCSVLVDSIGLYQVTQVKPSEDQYDLWSAVLSLIFLSTIIFFCLWLFRASKNTHALHPGKKIKFSPAWNVAFYFIPFVSFFLPFVGMKEIWLLNQKEGEGKGTALLWFWWLTFVIFNLFATASTKYTLKYPSDTLNYLYIDMLCNVFGILSALAATKIVSMINKAQMQKVNVGLSLTKSGEAQQTI